MSRGSAPYDSAAELSTFEDYTFPSVAVGDIPVRIVTRSGAERLQIRFLVEARYSFVPRPCLLPTQTPVQLFMRG